jgi:hypothetical protein
MKQIICLTAGLALTVLTGCVTLSVYPYYTAKDVTFDPALVGVWAEPGKTNADRETWTFERVDDQSYRLTVTEDDKKTGYDARLFKLKGHTLLDCLPRERTDCLIPGHVLLRVDSLQPALEMRLLDYGWLGKLIEKQPKAIRHVMVPGYGQKADDEMLVLTADTAELQKFVLKHLQTEDAWSDKIEMTRQ